MKYYILDNNKESKGPFSIEQLTEMGISPDTMVWCKGMTNWMKASEVEELSEILSSRNKNDNDMNSIVCKECGCVFSTKMKSCPECGCPASENVDVDEQQPSASDSHSYKKEGLGYLDVDSDNVFVGIFRWFSPKDIALPYNSKPTKVTVAVDNDAEDVFEIEKSLFYMLEAFTLKLIFVYLAYFILVGLVLGGISSMIYNSVDTYDGYTTATVFVAILVVIILVISIIVCFMIFLYIFRPYWSHIHVRLRELHIRHWRNVYRAIKDVE